MNNNLWTNGLLSGISSRIEAAINSGLQVKSDSHTMDKKQAKTLVANNKNCLNNNDENYTRIRNKLLSNPEDILEQSNSLSKDGKEKSIDSIDTFDSEISNESNNINNQSIQETRYIDLNDVLLNHNNVKHKNYRIAGSSGIGSEQSTSYESSEAEESTIEDQNTCDERTELKKCLDSPNSSYSEDSQLEENLRTIKKFIKNFVYNIFMDSSSISVEEKAIFGQYCRTETGRLWFSRYISKQRVYHQEVNESTFFSLIQYFAILLFECSDSDDFSPAKVIMNMCFTFYYTSRNNGSNKTKQYLYQYLREQPIWRSLRFWNAAFFDAVQCERNKRPSLRKSELSYYSDEEVDDENKYQQNITFGQLVTFTHNMKEFGLPKEQCVDFLNKQCSIASLPKEQIVLLHQNLNRMYSSSNHIIK